jgi:predicted glycoside hydrolase/deacetylase ChbG (UPF0249 family)
LQKTALRVVLHADDLGLNAAVTDGIMQGFRRGLLTSTSILANAPDAHRALSLWKQLQDDFSAEAVPSKETRRYLDDPADPFDLGVHLNLTQGRPLSGKEYPRELLDRKGCFLGIFSLFSRLLRCDAVALRKVRNELARQIEFVLDRGLQPTHVNGHQYIELLPAVSALLPELLESYQIRTVRVAEEPHLTRTTLFAGYSPQTWALAMIKRYYARRFHAIADRLGVNYPDHFHGTAHAGQITFEVMRRFLEFPSPSARGAGDEGWEGIASTITFSSSAKLIEIGLHPAMPVSEITAEKNISHQALADGWTDPLSAHRPQELQLLTSPELAEYFTQRRIRLGRLSQLSAT